MKKIVFIVLLICFVLSSCKTVQTKEEGSVSNSQERENSVAQTEPPPQQQTANSKSIDERFNFTIEDDTPSDMLNGKISNLFKAIEEKIATGDFDGWYSALSYKYKKFISDKANLLSMSRESDYLYSRNIVLETPRDYFREIVVPSRQGSTLKYINYDYIDKNHIKVNCILDDSLKFVYDFIREDGSWKVDKK